MRYTKKLRLLLLVIAVLPPLIIISIFKFSTEHKIELEQIKNKETSLYKAEAFILSKQGRVKYNVQQLLKDSLFLKHISVQKKPIAIPKEFLQKYDFSFLYIIDNSGKTVFSSNKLNRLKKSSFDILKLLDNNFLEKETDLQGDHAALTFTSEVDSSYYVYAGRYIDQSMVYLIENISDASVSIQFENYTDRQKQKGIYKTESGLQAMLLYAPDEGITITLDFSPDNREQLFTTLFQIISIVTVCMMVLSILLGFYFTGKTKKEIDNLRAAFADVAEGNFNTTVMAYEESEFSELADSFSEMVRKLKDTQSKLSTVEKIAAWETVGRKLAHEIKNPLSPIAIAADDLRSSYYDKLPNFESIRDETTTTIKKEVKRMTLLLDEFVSFARMEQSELQKVEFSQFVSEIQKLYSKEIEAKRLHIESNISNILVELDKDTITQLFINLIKNGFESYEKAIVDITITRTDENIKISIADNGPGFSQAKLENSFKPFETTKENGTGLGLIICHRIVLDHNGTMKLQNRKDKGGEVVITLPIV